MHGRAIAGLQSRPRRWLLRVWGTPDVHTRLKWRALWPHLQGLPTGALRLLDAGCGNGHWCLELAARRPQWHVTGLDVSASSIETARASQASLGLRNVSFEVADFRGFHPAEPFDAVLSVASAHYLAEVGQGPELFDAFASWLRPEGSLVLYAPRRGAEVPWVRVLPRPFEFREVFSKQALERLCAESNLRVISLSPAVRRLGTLAKQINRAGVHCRPLGLITYPVQLALAVADSSRGDEVADGGSCGWVLVARRAARPV